MRLNVGFSFGLRRQFIAKLLMLLFYEWEADWFGLYIADFSRPNGRLIPVDPVCRP
jgi:hypothetical protein